LQAQKPTISGRAKLSVHLGAGSSLGSAIRSASLEELQRHNKKRGGWLIIGDDPDVIDEIQAAQEKARPNK